MQPGPRPDPGAAGRTWAQPEILWPLAIAAGFLGSIAGTASGVSGLAPGLAAAGFAPLFRYLLLARRRQLAALAGLAWIVAIAAGVVGMALEGGPPGPAELPAGAPGVQAGALGTSLGALLVCCLLARLWTGAASLLAIAFLVVQRSALAATALQADFDGEEPLTAILRAWPGGSLLVAAGALLLTAAIAEPVALRPLPGLPLGRRRLLWGGTGLALAGLLIDVWGGRPAWQLP